MLLHLGLYYIKGRLLHLDVLQGVWSRKQVRKDKVLMNMLNVAHCILAF